MSSLIGLLPLFIVVAVVLVVIFTELFKRLDKNDKMKGYRVWVPFLFSAFFAFLLWQGAFFAPREVWFWWSAIFGISVFFYEAILKKLQNAWLEKKS